MKVRMPLLVKIKNRYGKLHKKWQSERMRRMKDMGLSGGEGDVAAVCPICNVDKSRTIKVYLSNVTEANANWKLNYITFPKTKIVS